MDQIQTIEKLFSYNTVVYSYLLLPVLALIFRNKMLSNIFLTLLIYGTSCFFLLFYFHDLPKELRGYYFTFYTFFEYSAFAALFYFNIKSKLFKKIIIISSLCFLIYQCVYLFTAKIQALDSVPIGIETILIFVFIFAFFYLW